MILSGERALYGGKSSCRLRMENGLICAVLIGRIAGRVRTRALIPVLIPVLTLVLIPALTRIPILALTLANGPAMITTAAEERQFPSKMTATKITKSEIFEFTKGAVPTQTAQRLLRMYT